MRCLWACYIMENISVKDTTAYKIIRQLLDHIYGSDVELNDEDFLHIYATYMRLGGTWEGMIRGSMPCFDLLVSLLDSYMDIKSSPEEYGLE